MTVTDGDIFGKTDTDSHQGGSTIDQPINNKISDICFNFLTDFNSVYNAFLADRSTTKQCAEKQRMQTNQKCVSDYSV